MTKRANAGKCVWVCLNGSNVGVYLTLQVCCEENGVSYSTVTGSFARNKLKPDFNRQYRAKSGALIIGVDLKK